MIWAEKIADGISRWRVLFVLCVGVMGALDKRLMRIGLYGRIQTSPPPKFYADSIWCSTRPCRAAQSTNSCIVSTFSLTWML